MDATKHCQVCIVLVTLILIWGLGRSVAEEPTLEGVLRAIEDRWSVACSTAGRASIAAYGSFELVDYAYWLEEQFFPEHDRLCAREAALAMETLRGSEIPEGTMSGCRAALADLYTKCWG